MAVNMNASPATKMYLKQQYKLLLFGPDSDDDVMLKEDGLPITPGKEVPVQKVALPKKKIVFNFTKESVAEAKRSSLKVSIPWTKLQFDINEETILPRLWTHKKNGSKRVFTINGKDGEKVKIPKLDAYKLGLCKYKE